MNPVNNPLHLTTRGDTRIPFSKQLYLKDYVCAVTEIKGEFQVEEPQLYTNEWFLCCDFVHESIVDRGTLPVLHRIPCKLLVKNNIQRVNTEFSINLWVGCNRDDINEVRLYITDKNGTVPSFINCTLKCSLICIPRRYLL
jgi:hypothetical protein